MIKTVEATGKTIDEAINSAYSMLGLDRDSAEASVEVVDRPKSGFLGIGSVPAKVRVSVGEADPEPAAPVAAKPAVKPAAKPVEARPAKPAVSSAPAVKPVSAEPVQPAAQLKPAEAAQPDAKPDRPAQAARPSEPRRRPDSQRPPRPAQNRRPSEPRRTEPAVRLDAAEAEKAIAAASAFLAGLLERMGAKARPEMKFNDEGTLEIELVGDDLGMLIGRRGDTLNAIQHITSYVINKDRSGDRVRVTVDVENYRVKREEALQRLAHKTALKVVRYKRNISLEPMNAYERHVIHTALQDWRDVSTFSSGSEPRRCVVISYTPGNGGGASGDPRPDASNAPDADTPDVSPETSGVESGEHTARALGAPRAPRDDRRGGGRGGRRDGDRREPREPREPQADRPKPKPLEEQVWE